MRGRLVHRSGNLRPAHTFRWVEHAQPHARSEQLRHRIIDLRFADQALAHRCRQGGVFLPALQFGSVLDGQRRRFLAAGNDLVVLPYIDDGPAIGNHVALEAPVAAQQVAQQEMAGAGGLAIHAVVGAHHRIHIALFHQCFEGRQVGVVQIALARARIEVMAVGFRAAVYGQVLGSGVQLAVDGIVTLQTVHEGNTHASGEVRILAVGFLTAAPARVAEDVDVGRPESQPLIARMRTLTDELVMLGARLVADRGSHLPHQRYVESSRQTDGLRKNGGLPCACHAVQAFIPPVVGGYAKTFDGRRSVLHLGGLFLQGHLRNQRRSTALEAGRGIQPGLGVTGESRR
ncbi:hypothetical protein D3C71_1039740 [compost metagenome]